jgi:hypothetical protein
MAKKKRKPGYDADWAEAKRLCRLNQEDIRMAKELGFSPRTLMKNRPSPTQQWKLPVKEWIRELYEKRKSATGAKPPPPAEPKALELPMVPAGDDEDELGEPFDIDFEEDALGLEEDPHDERVVAENNERMLRRQSEFAVAAEYVARAFARFPEVAKVALIGSVAVPLKKEVPRFKAFRRAGVALYHECKDVDVAVWLTSLANLRELGKARGKAMNELLANEDIGVAHHQIDVFLLEPGTNRYLGRLCIFGQCPKGKPECRVPGCGETLFLQQHEGFRLRPDALAAERISILFERTTVADQDEEIPF